MPNSALNGVNLKLIRAEKHLNEVILNARRYAHGECHITPEKHLEHKATVLRISLTPKPPPELSGVVGDFLFNIRSLLDHLVWQLVLINTPNKPGPHNQFPITTSADDFATAVGKRHFLKGVPEKAVTLIESLQPYKTGDNLLGLLNKLHNIDKHRTLNVITIVADNTALTFGTYLQLLLGGEELRDGAVFGDIAIPFDLPDEFARLNDRLPKMKVEGKCSFFIAFDDPVAEDLEDFRVDRTLQEILNFIRETVIPTFKPFFD